MSQEFQKDQQFTEQTTTTNPNRNRNILFIIIIGILVAVNIYLLLSRNKASNERDVAYQQLDTVSLDRDRVTEEYDAALARLDLLVSKNTQLDSMINNRDSEIARLKSQIHGILNNSRSTAADYARARNLINEMNSRIRNYQERIAELEAENVRITDYNVILSEERDSAVTQNIALSQKVRLAAVLHASNIRMVPIDLRRNGRKEKTTEKAKNVDVFRVTFDIDENRVTENGIKDLYLRIIGPGGRLLSNAAYGSGVTTTFDGDNLNYTLHKQIDLRQGEPVRDIVVDWHQDSDYARGNYTIEIYHDGFKIGSGGIDLR